MASKFKNDLTKIIKDIAKEPKNRRNERVWKTIGQKAIRLIVKRTRLGYGVDKNLGKRSRLKPLDPDYVKQRRRARLAGTTRPKRSNLTRTGQMLNNMNIIGVRRGKLSIGPTGRRNDGKKNRNIAKWNEEKGRVFNRLSLNEFKQLQRTYRKLFGDLLKKRRLLR